MKISTRTKEFIDRTPKLSGETRDLAILIYETAYRQGVKDATREQVPPEISIKELAYTDWLEHLHKQVEGE